MSILFEAIGTIHTPYLPSLPVPHQPLKDAPGEFWITLNPDYVAGLDQLASFRYLYILYHLDQAGDGFKLRVNPPWAPEAEVGLFAGRNPQRPNPIGLSIVELKGIEGNEILISGIDVYNNTPLLDIKPYFKSFDLKPDANDGWIEALPDHDHLLAHLLELDHDHSHDHNDDHRHSHSPTYEPGHSHGHEHGHNHSHSQAADQDQCLTTDEHAHNHAHNHNHGHTHSHSYSHNHTHDHSHTHNHEHENFENHLHHDHHEHDHDDDHEVNHGHYGHHNHHSHDNQDSLHGHSHSGSHTHVHHDHTHLKRFKGNLKKLK